MYISHNQSRSLCHKIHQLVFGGRAQPEATAALPKPSSWISGVWEGMSGDRKGRERTNETGEGKRKGGLGKRTAGEKKEERRRWEGALVDLTYTPRQFNIRPSYASVYHNKRGRITVKQQQINAADRQRYSRLPVLVHQLQRHMAHLSDSDHLQHKTHYTSNALAVHSIHTAIVIVGYTTVYLVSPCHFYPSLYAPSHCK